jgi:hypothetical protein
MGFIRFLVWTFMCIGFGVFAATWEIDGKTPVQHLKVIIKPQTFEGSLEMARRTFAGKKGGPTEQHSPADRDAVNRLLAAARANSALR